MSVSLLSAHDHQWKTDDESKADERKPEDKVDVHELAALELIPSTFQVNFLSWGHNVAAIFVAGGKSAVLTPPPNCPDNYPSEGDSARTTLK